jgi:Helix-turn-helix domain
VKLLTTKEAAAHLGIHVNTLRRYNLPHYVLNERGDRRYDLEALDQWLEARARNVGTSPTNSTRPSSAPAKGAMSGASSFVVRKVK